MGQLHRQDRLAPLPDPETIDSGQLAASLKSGGVDLVCVLGPTASGKTKYAVRLAVAMREFGVEMEIISADSRQVYRGMDIGTGKDLCEYADVPYHLIDVADPGSGYNVYRFKQDFEVACEDIRSRGRFPLLCGGTGMYISAVVCDYDFQGRKPLSAALDGVGGGSGRPDSGVFFIGTLVSREVRNERIDARLDARLEEGMVDEIHSLLDGTSPACHGTPVPPEVLLSYGLEYKFVTLYLQGQLTYSEMRDQLSIAIHQFAKRQMTWFRGMERSGIRIHWVEV